jgi:1,4-alpha-glucan branching enzyme
MDKAYGTKEMYKDFIDECHKRDMAVILDVVYNHATGANPFAKLYWNSTANKTASNNPWFNVDAPHPYSVFHDLNHESPLVRTFVKRNLEFLLNEYKVDGFRFDLGKGFTQKKSTESTAGNHDPSRIAILKDYNATIKAANPNAIVILEHFAEEKEEKELAEDGMHLWRNLNNAYCQTGMGYKEGSAFTMLTTQGTTMPFGGWVGYMESHDEERVSYKQITWGIDAVKNDLVTRMRQLGANASLFLTVPGPKMIWQFGELGYDVSIEENGRTGKKPVKWDYCDNLHRKGLYDTYRKLIELRTSVPQLFDSESTFVWNVRESDWGNGRTLSLKTHDGKGLVVVANFTNAKITCTSTFPSTGTWHNYMDGEDTLDVETVEQTVEVPANNYLVYRNF